jgi:hypothetical protein
MITLLLNGTHLSVTEAEAAILKPLVEELEGLAGRPFAHDPPLWMATLPAHVLTPLRIRALIAKRLEPCVPARAIDFERRILKALTVNGKPFLELESPSSRAATVDDLERFKEGAREAGRAAADEWRRKGPL